MLLLLLHLGLVLCLGLVLGIDLCFKKTTKPRAPGNTEILKAEVASTDIHHAQRPAQG